MKQWPELTPIWGHEWNRTEKPVQSGPAKINRHSRYLETFLTSKSAPDMLALGVFPNAKEITESYAMFEATNMLGNEFAWNNPDVTVLCVGDGRKPRTACTFAFRTAWNCISIDPGMANQAFPVNRLTLFRDKVENYSFVSDKPTLIVLPHSHAKIEDCLRVIKSPVRAVIAMECCVRQVINGVPPTSEYIDENVWSPKNLVRVWRHV